jgi:tetratricopeptide (TPR) repeat protein
MRWSTLTFVLGILLGGAWCVAGAGTGADNAAVPNSKMDIGFHLLYELRFAEARTEFTEWEKAQPNEAMGPMAEASSYLFEEFYAQGVLTSDYFLDDDRLLGGKPMKANPGRSAAFLGALDRAQKLALARLHENRNDTNALLALELSTGMRADYASIIERKQYECLGLIKDSDAIATRLLSIDPSRADADICVGKALYIIGCLPTYKRFFLWFDGIQGDRAAGMDRLRMTAENGQYLRPYGKMLLGLAALREKQTDLARSEFQQLVTEFPGNPLFAKELAKLNQKSASNGSH